jgi:hypothetical protein
MCGPYGHTEHEVPVITTKPRRKRKVTKPGRSVTDVLLELAYYLHTTKVVARPTERRRGG